jgi:hypothetical protein
MAVILEFRGLVPRSASASFDAASRAGAEIVLFPGVRYERWEDANIKPKASGDKKCRRRDTLELDD